MKIQSVYDAAFQAYGQILEGYDTAELVKAMEKEFGPEKGSSRYLYKLFPDGPALIATKIAGLPRPVKCI